MSAATADRHDTCYTPSLSHGAAYSLCVRWFESHNSSACETVKLFAYALCVLEREAEADRQTAKERRRHSDSKTVHNIVADY